MEPIVRDGIRFHRQIVVTVGCGECECGCCWVGFGSELLGLWADGKGCVGFRSGCGLFVAAVGVARWCVRAVGGAVRRRHRAPLGVVVGRGGATDEGVTPAGGWERADLGVRGCAGRQLVACGIAGPLGRWAAGPLGSWAAEPPGGCAAASLVAMWWVWG
ncbi:hypothetical protein GCM10029964_023980 [Kibdelosporangium lantanae]